MVFTDRYGHAGRGGNSALRPLADEVRSDRQGVVDLTESDFGLTAHVPVFS